MSKKKFSISGAPLWCGIILAAVGFIYQVILGSPFETLHLLIGLSYFPPIWIFNLLSSAWFFLIGIAAGAVIHATAESLNIGSCETLAYKGGLFFLSCVFLSLIRYYLLFFSLKLLLSLVTSIICLICSFVCAFIWRKVHPHLSSIIMFAFSIWQFYFFLINTSVFLHN